MHSIHSLFHSTTQAVAFRVFGSLHKRGRLPASCSVLALMLCGAWVGVHAQTAHFAWAQSVIANAANNGLDLPFGIAVDDGGNVYIADSNNDRVLKETFSAGSYTQSVVANAAINGLASYPYGVAVDGSGNVYIGDTSNARVLKETLSAGGYTQSVVADGLNNHLAGPYSIAVDVSGNVYIADLANNRVLKETLSAGSYTQSVVANSATNGLDEPMGVAVDGTGNVYIADYANSRVLKETLSAGSYTQSVVENSATNGLLYPQGVAVDGSGNVYIAGSVGVLKETPSASGYVESFVANNANNGLNYPSGVAVDRNGRFYIVDRGNSRVLEEASSGGNFGAVNVGSTSLTPISMVFTFDTAGTLGSTSVVAQGAKGLDFVDAGSGTCKAGTAYTAGETCTVDVSFKPKFAGTRYGAAELLDSSGNVLATGYVQGTGVGPQVTFLPGTQSVIANSANNGLNHPFGVAVDGSGNVYISDDWNNRVLKETLSAGTYTQSVVANYASNGVYNPWGVAVDGNGNVYIADYYNQRVLKETPSARGYTQSVVANASINGLNSPEGVAVDGSGNVYIADYWNNRVLKETLSAGSYTQSVVANAAVNGLDETAGVAVDGSGNVYIADYYSKRVLKETLSAGNYTQTVIANSANNGLDYPYGVAVDGSGNVYIADSANNRVLKETPSAGSYAQSVIANSAANGLDSPMGVAVDGSGNVYIADGFNARVLNEDFADPPSLTFASAPVGARSSDSPQTVTLENIGNAALSFPVPATGNNPSISPNFTLNSSLESACPFVSAGSSSPGVLAAGTSCLFPISFSPTTQGSLSGSLVLTGNALNISGSTQSISLSGAGTPAPATLTSPTPGSTLAGSSVVFTWPAVAAIPIYDLHLSTVGPGDSDLYSSGAVAGPYVTVTGLPTNGATIYARLYSWTASAWHYTDTTYTAAAQAVLTTPTPGSLLTGPSVTFDWTAATGSGNQGYWLFLGTTGFGSNNLYDSHQQTATSATFNNLPTNGETIYARVYTRYNGTLVYNDYTYTAWRQPPVMTSPAPGSTLTGASATFTWTAASPGNQGYWLFLGTTGVGSKNLYDSGQQTATSGIFSNLPTNGETIYARLYTRYSGVLVYNDYTYKAQ